MSSTLKCLRAASEQLAQTDPLLQWGSKFVDLEECSEKYQEAYKNAWKAIKHGNMRNLQDSIENMKKHAGTCPGHEGYLDVCYRQHEMSLRRRKRTFYYMSLLAYAGICGHENLVIKLIKSKARPDVGDCLSGLPLTQILVYAVHHNCPEVISSEILQHITDVNLNINVFDLISEDGSCSWCSPVELAMKVKRIDIAGQLVKAGANPIDPFLDRTSGVPQLLDEYYEFGTNKYISWLLHQHLLSHEIPPFIETVVKLDIFNDTGIRMFNEVGRHPAHALFTCGSEEMISQLLDHHKDLKVNVKDGSGRTALQIATEEGDLESVMILLKFYRKIQESHSSGSDDDSDESGGGETILEKLLMLLETNASEEESSSEGSRAESDLSNGAKSSKTQVVKETADDAISAEEFEMADLGVADVAKSDDSKTTESEKSEIIEEINKDLKKALLAAARNGDLKILRCLLEDNIWHVFAIVNQAVEEGLTSLFEVLRDHPLIYRLLTGDNSLVHIAARTGNAKLFKVFFPLQPDNEVSFSVGHRHKANMHKYQRLITSDNAKQMFEALTMQDGSEKTPLHLAIDCNHICILKTLQERIIERESTPGVEQQKEKNAWDVFWKEWGPKLFVYGCAHGTVEVLKFLMEMEQEYGESDGSLLKEADVDLDTPLSAAATNGNDEILLYLLDVCRIPIPKSAFRSPLLLAAENGHAACISILLKKGADITQKDWLGFNCLMIATERKHSHAVMAILSDKKGFEALRCKKKSVTPMRMLIQHMPEAAEWILNRCVLEKHKLKRSSDGLGFEETDGSSSDIGCGLLNEFEFLEDFKPPGTVQDNDDDDEPDIGGNSEEDSDSSNFDIESKRVDWRPEKYHSSNHTIKLMVKYNRERLLNHVLVKTLIKYKWWKIGFPILFVSFSFHASFLILLTVFALLLPTAGPACATGLLNNTTSVFDDISCEETGLDNDQRRFLISSAVIVILFCGFYLLLEAFQILKRKPRKYLSDPQNYFQIVTYCTVIVFVFPLGHTCWCYPSWKWQVGALALFLAWINNLVLLKQIPQVGKPITMLFNVYVNFLKLIYLPILLVLTFAFPFYMLFVATMQEGINELMMALYSTPFHAMWSVILQTADGPDAQFFSATLSHQIMTYILFITFIVAVPILFNNFLTGMAVGETEKERRKAKLSLIKAKVDYIFESEDSIFFYRRCCYGRLKPKLKIDTHKLELLKLRNESYLEELKLEGDVQKSLKKLQSEFAGSARSLDALEGKVKQVFSAVQELRNDVVKKPEKSYL